MRRLAIATNWLVIRIDPRTGRTSSVARLLLPASWQGPADTGNVDAVVYGGCLYLLVASPEGTGGDLYRVRV